MKTNYDYRALLDAATKGERVALARLLTRIEQGDRAVAAMAYRAEQQATTIGVTGAPGAGKSTLVDKLIVEARRGGAAQVAVLAVDPSSPFSGGAILGDRVRMQDHALDDGVYIRSMASRGHLGGLAAAVPEAIRLLAAAGLPLVIVETVGVGQVELEVASATDSTLVVLNPKWGDAIQASKAGLLEAADIFVINKADNPGARDTKRDLEQMLDLSPEGDWRPPIIETVATDGSGVAELWSAIEGHLAHLDSSGDLHERRTRRLDREFRAALLTRMELELQSMCDDGAYANLARDVAEHKIDPFEAAEHLMNQWSADARAAGGRKAGSGTADGRE